MRQSRSCSNMAIVQLYIPTVIRIISFCSAAFFFSGCAALFKSPEKLNFDAIKNVNKESYYILVGDSLSVENYDNSIVSFLNIVYAGGEKKSQKGVRIFNHDDLCGNDESHTLEWDDMSYVYAKNNELIFRHWEITRSDISANNRVIIYNGKAKNIISPERRDCFSFFKIHQSPPRLGYYLPPMGYSPGFALFGSNYNRDGMTMQCHFNVDKPGVYYVGNFAVSGRGDRDTEGGITNNWLRSSTVHSTTSKQAQEYLRTNHMENLPFYDVSNSCSQASLQFLFEKLDAATGNSLK